LVGGYNLPNVLAAVAVGKYFKIEDGKIKEAIEAYLPSNSRSQLLQKGTNKIILDAYNANPSSMNFAIENFSAMEGENKTLVLGSMAELGEESLKEHQFILDKIKGINGKMFYWWVVILKGLTIRFYDFHHPPKPANG
jgi:UDP-N-acetylmuramoyl-tripeptide--D-alanyl-D-alanine ligase